jgi:hypothetical protein
MYPGKGVVAALRCVRERASAVVRHQPPCWRSGRHRRALRAQVQEGEKGVATMSRVAPGAPRPALWPAGA